ncbi:MAG: alanine--glyoxylate aminotransferase family protein [Thermoguttaceae bacterium]|nr:alanine--glyoxylate aminotransferase family protein [Thermoguttaceae bacterium]
MLNYRMLTPGPTPVPESSLQKLGRQVRHHRTADFTAVLERVTQNLKQVFKTERSSIAVLQGSGTSAMDACVSNVIVPGDVALVLYSGKFAERWANLVERYGGTAIRYEVPWGERFKPEKVKEYLDANPQIKAVYGTLVETSTGVQHDIAGIGQVVAQTNALWVVDGISGAGAVELWTDDWHIDLLAVGSQKALMTPPGLSVVAVSPKAKAVMESTPNRRVFYLDLLKYLNWEKTQGAPFTPARSLIEAMDESVRILLDESMETVWAENVTKSQMVRVAVAAWGERIHGMRIVAERSADALTVIHVPDAVNVKELLKELELSYGLKLAGAQGDWKGRAFRISNMGMVDVTDILAVVSALDVVLSRQTGVDVLGVGSAAAQKALMGK